MKYFKKLVGDRIYLSPRSVEDAELFTEWMNDFNTTDYIGRSCKVIDVESEKIFLSENLNKEASFAIINLENDQMIGTVSLEKINHIHRTGTLGIFIGDKNFRENGYGTEAIRLILEYGFKYLNLNNIDLKYLEFNHRAGRCYEKCGFKEYGKRSKCHFLNGKYYDEIFMQILADEFDGDWIRNKNV